MGIDHQLRKALIAHGESDYVVGKATKLGQSIIYRFKAGKGISLSNAAVVAAYLGLELRPKSRKK